jgi:hypothetical protein
MKSLSKNAIRLARVLIALVFVLNAIGVIDQTIPAKEMMERGVPAAIVPWLMFAGRALEFIAGVALVFGFSREQQLWRSSHSLFPQHWFRTRSGCRRVHRSSWAS